MPLADIIKIKTKVLCLLLPGIGGKYNTGNIHITYHYCAFANHCYHGKTKGIKYMYVCVNALA
jgi:hypothetical protein